MTYLTPATMEDALGELASGAVSVIAGGTDWFPTQGERPFTGTLMDVTRVPGMRGVEAHEGGWRLGGATTWTDVIRAELPPAFDGLKLAAREVGSVQIQNAGTLAGNICNASPAADGVPPLLTLNAEVELSSAAGVRRVPLGAFITGVRRTDRRPEEMVTAIHVPAPPEGATSSFFKLGARKYLVISITMCAAVIVARAGRIAEARLSVGAASPVAQRLPELEAALTGEPVEAAFEIISRARLPEIAPISDIRGTAEYRRDAVGEALRRVVAQALTEQA